MIKNLFSKILGGDSDSAGQQEEGGLEFTPRGFVSGFVSPPPGVKSLEAVWHSAAVALDTERIRIIYRQTKDGVYFIAADASDFVNHPNATTALVAALPGAPGHKGDGAYFIDIGAGMVAVVIKEDLSLKSYIGERSEALRFANNKTAFWPAKGEAWVGFSQFESRYAKKLAVFSILAGMGLSGLFLAAGVTATVMTTQVTHQKEVTINHIRAEQQSSVNTLKLASASDAYSDYRKLVSAIIPQDGNLLRFNSEKGITTWEVDFPPWVSDLSKLGPGVKIRSEKGRVFASKD